MKGYDKSPPVRGPVVKGHPEEQCHSVRRGDTRLAPLQRFADVSDDIPKCLVPRWGRTDEDSCQARL